MLPFPRRRKEQWITRPWKDSFFPPLQTWHPHSIWYLLSQKSKQRARCLSCKSQAMPRAKPAVIFIDACWQCLTLAGLACLICSLCGFQSDNCLEMTRVWLILMCLLFLSVGLGYSCSEGCMPNALGIGLVAGQIWGRRRSLPDALQAKASKCYIPAFQKWWDEPSALMSHGRSVAVVSWIPGGPHGYLLSRHQACQVMGMSCRLYFDLALCTEPHSLTSDCIQYPGQASWLWMMASPFLKCQVCYGKKILWLSRSQAPIDLCAGMRQFHTGEKNTTQTNTPTPPNQTTNKKMLPKECSG